MLSRSRGRAALQSPRRRGASALAKIQAVSPEVTVLDARWVHLVASSAS